MPTGNFTPGNDISHWQCLTNPITKEETDIDFSKMVAKGSRFCFVRASWGSQIDHKFLVNWENAGKAGLLRAAYLYLRWNEPGADQADDFLKIIEKDPGEIYPIVDFEEEEDHPPSDAMRGHLWNAMAAIRAKYGNAILYTSPSFWATYGNRQPNWAQFPLYVAHWGAEKPTVPAPWSNYTFWQYNTHGDGKAYGVASLDLDMDVFNGSYETLKSFCMRLPQQPPEPPKPPTDPNEKLNAAIAEAVNANAALVDVCGRVTKATGDLLAVLKNK